MKNRIREWLDLLGAMLCLALIALAGGCCPCKQLAECNANLAQYANARVMRGCHEYMLHGQKGYTCSHEVGNPAYGATGYGLPQAK